MLWAGLSMHMSSSVYSWLLFELSVDVVCPLQVPVLSVWQPDRYAVSDQRSVRPAPAASLHGHGGTPGRRPSMGKVLQTLPLSLLQQGECSGRYKSVSARGSHHDGLTLMLFSGERWPVGAEPAGVLPAPLPVVPRPPPPAPQRRARRGSQDLRQD